MFLLLLSSFIVYLRLSTFNKVYDDDDDDEDEGHLSVQGHMSGGVCPDTWLSWTVVSIMTAFRHIQESPHKLYQDY